MRYLEMIESDVPMGMWFSYIYLLGYKTEFVILPHFMGVDQELDLRVSASPAQV